MTLLVVVAHPDNEAFGCGSVLLHAAGRTRTVVVCASRGEAGDLAPGAEEPTAGLAAMREAELRRAGEILGTDVIEFLDIPDSGMSDEPRVGSICAIEFDALKTAVAAAIERHEPSVIVTLDGSDGHRDHLRIRDAVLAVAPPEVPVYLHCPPKSLMRQWLIHRTGEASAEVYAALPDIGTPDEDVTTLIDTSVHLPARLQAIAEHRSQTSPFDNLPDDLMRGFLATEHLRRANPAWTGGPVESDLLGLPSVSVAV